MIFLGAGASAPFGIPTADTLTAEIRNMLSKDQQGLLSDIEAFWNKNYEGKDPNYENILTILMGLTDPRKIARNDIVRAFVGDFKKYRGNYETIIDEMYSRIVNYCTAPFVSGDKYIAPVDLEEIFHRTYDLFTFMSNELVFTTNYDPSIEIWCQKRNIQIYDGTNTISNPEIKVVLPINEDVVNEGETKLRPARRFGQQNLSLKLVRLHGSAWVYETDKGSKIKMNRPRDKLLFTDSYTYLKKKPHIIFPGQESILAGREWDKYYQYFKKTLRGRCLVIGYSFNDPLINQVFINNLTEGQLHKLGIVDPHAEEILKNLFWSQSIPRNQIVQMTSEFGTDYAIHEIYQKWITGVLGFRFSGRVDKVLSEYRKRMQSYVG